MLMSRIKNKLIREIVEFAIAAAIAAAVFFVVFNFVARTGRVNGVSMEPTLSHGEIVVINRMAYWFNEPRMGDIIAFPDPENTDRHLIKRVVGVGGDEIDYINNVVFVNGEVLPPQYRMLDEGGRSVPFPLIVPEGEVFVLGDNRWASKDSRYVEVGNIPVSEITGRIPVRIWPISMIGSLRASDPDTEAY